MNKNVYAESSVKPSQINELIGYIRSFRRYPKGYRALHLHFSVLDRLHQQPHHRRSIATAFNKLIQTDEGKLFWLDPFDLFFISKNCSHTKLEKAKFDAFRSVSDSPVLKRIIENGKDNELCDWYELEDDYDKFLNIVETIANAPKKSIGNNESEKNPSLQNLMANLDFDTAEVPKGIIQKKEPFIKKEPTVPNYNHIFPKEVIPVMGPVQLDKLERNIVNIDLISMIREQNICVVIDEITPQIVFSKRYVSLGEINKSLLPGYNISGDKWLFQRLTKTFDSKVMQSLINNKNFPDHVLSINMNVQSVLTNEFDVFIKKQKELSDHPLILEITLFDIMSDLTEYYQVQQKLTKLGCKICISNMDIQSLYVLDRELINVDFLKIKWNNLYRSSVNQHEKKKIISAIENQGKMRVVLSNCDSEQALNFGRSIGIVMYQGFEVDKLQGL